MAYSLLGSEHSTSLRATGESSTTRTGNGACAVSAARFCGRASSLVRFVTPAEFEAPADPGALEEFDAAGEFGAAVFDTVVSFSDAISR